MPEAENDITPVVYADYHGNYRPDSLNPRQHAFLRLLVDRPELAVYEQSITWTVLCEGLEDNEDLASTALESWAVFSRMINVFPGVTTLRHLGWTHSGLVEAILSSIRLGGWI